jgi:hypothetical protein
MILTQVYQATPYSLRFEFRGVARNGGARSERNDLLSRASAYLLGSIPNFAHRYERLVSAALSGDAVVAATRRKVMRMQAQTAMIENGFVHVPERA